MGEAFDRTGHFLGSVEAATKHEVLEKLQAQFGDRAHEIRIRSLSNNDGGASAEMPRYKSHKIVHALKIIHVSQFIDQCAEAPETDKGPVAEQSVYESCQCPAKPGEPCPFNERECANRVKKALAVRYLDRAAKLSGCSWDCHEKYVSAGFDACCSTCQNIALAMVDAMSDGRYLSLTLRAEAPETENERRRAGAVALGITEDELAGPIGRTTGFVQSSEAELQAICLDIRARLDKGDDAADQLAYWLGLTTDSPAVRGCMGSVDACAENGCQYRKLPLPPRAEALAPSKLDPAVEAQLQKEIAGALKERRDIYEQAPATDRSEQGRWSYRAQCNASHLADLVQRLSSLRAEALAPPEPPQK